MTNSPLMFEILTCRNVRVPDTIDAETGAAFVFVRENASYSPGLNALIAMAKEGGRTLLAAWHRDRRDEVSGGKGDPDAET